MGYYEISGFRIIAGKIRIDSILIPCSKEEARQRAELLRPFIDMRDRGFKGSLPVYLQGQVPEVLKILRELCRKIEGGVKDER